MFQYSHANVHEDKYSVWVARWNDSTILESASFFPNDYCKWCLPPAGIIYCFYYFNWNVRSNYIRLNKMQAIQPYLWLAVAGCVNVKISLAYMHGIATHASYPIKEFQRSSDFHEENPRLVHAGVEHWSESFFLFFSSFLPSILPFGFLYLTVIT